jgi:NAD(P)-dependent dehydrogenase (short-subunit alcohol dehydrogenase family)
VERWALVTGAAGDLGRAACLALAADGWSLQITDHPSQRERLASTCEACVGVGATVISGLFDVTDTGAVGDGIGDLSARHGVPAAVVANAGVQGEFGPIHRAGVDDLRRVLDINVVGVFNTVAAAARVMIDAGASGAMVVAASMAGVSGAPNMAGYSASKAAVVGLVKSAAKDLAPFGLRVNAISPAFIGPGAMWERQVDAQANVDSQYFATDPTVVARQMIEAIPMRRYGSPAEVADVIAYLLSERSSYLTGVNIEISGGSA